MILAKYAYLIFLICSFSIGGLAQNFSNTIDSLADVSTQANDYGLSYKNLLLPSVLIAAGSVSFAVPAMKKLDVSISSEVSFHNPTTTSWDSYVQFFPVVMVYGLNFAGVKSKHNFKERSIIYVTTQLLVSGIVLPSKSLIGEERPDGSDRKSFPSGHAAIAFSNAHFMYREYRESSPWLSVAGYPFALFTGIYRIVNNRHWMTDVVAGAGVGILSTELSYWIFPRINSILNRKTAKVNATLVPFYRQKNMGLSFVRQF